MMRKPLPGAGVYAFSDLRWQDYVLWPVYFRNRREQLLASVFPEKGVNPFFRKLIHRKADRILIGMPDGHGKITDCGYDLFAALAVKLPADRAFSITAGIRILQYPEEMIRNGQEGCGLFVRDTMRVDPVTGYFYSDMAAAGAIANAHFFHRSGASEPGRAQIRSNWTDGLPLNTDFEARITRTENAVRLEMLDDAGKEMFPAEECGLPFAARDGKAVYAGLFACRGAEIEVRKDSVRVEIGREIPAAGSSGRKRTTEMPEETKNPADAVLPAETASEGSVEPLRDGANVLIVSPDGTENGDGTGEAPLTLARAAVMLGKSKAGGVIELLPGRYFLREDLVLAGGEPGKRILRGPSQGGSAAPAQSAVLDFSGTDHGLILCGDGWTVENLCVTNGLGIRISGSRNVIRGCRSYGNRETGFEIRLREDEIGMPAGRWPSYNKIEACAAFANCDPSERNADGFACKVAAGEGNVFLRCLSFLNADDGFDLFAKDRPIGAVEIRECESIGNGYRLMPDGSLQKSRGNGNGYKLGGSGQIVRHKVFFSTAKGNKACGFTSNSNPWMYLEGCRAGSNGRDGFRFYFSSRTVRPQKVLKECTERKDAGFATEAVLKEMYGKYAF